MSIKNKSKVPDKVDSWQCIHLFERVHESMPLSTSEQSIWLALYRKCNALRWPVVFYWSIESLLISANVTRPTAKAGLKRLVELQLVRWKPGVRKGIASVFQLLSSGVSDLPLSTVSGVSSGVSDLPLSTVSGVSSGVSDLPPHNNKTSNTNKNTPLPNGEERDFLKQEKTEHWNDLKKEWTDTYEALKKTSYPWNDGKDGKALKEIAAYLKGEVYKAGYEYEKDIALFCFATYINAAYYQLKNAKDEPWIQNYFELSMLNKHLKIIGPLFKTGFDRKIKGMVGGVWQAHQKESSSGSVAEEIRIKEYKEYRKKIEERLNAKFGHLF